MPFKKKDSLQHISATLNLPIEGTCDELQNQILEHVKQGKVKDDTVREIALKFSENANKKKMESTKAKSATPIAAKIVATPAHHSTPVPVASQSLFSQSIRQSQDDIGNASHELGDSLIDDENDDENTDSDYLDALEKVKQAIAATEKADNNDVTAAEIDHLCDDITNLTLHGLEGTNGKDNDKEKEELIDQKWAIKLLKKFEYMVDKSVEIVAAKDHQLVMMQESIKVLVNSTSAILEKYGKEVTDIKEKVDLFHQKGSIYEDKLENLTKSIENLSHSSNSANSDMSALAKTLPTSNAVSPAECQLPPSKQLLQPTPPEHPSACSIQRSVSSSSTTTSSASSGSSENNSNNKNNNTEPPPLMPLCGQGEIHTQQQQNEKQQQHQPQPDVNQRLQCIANGGAAKSPSEPYQKKINR